MSIAVSVVVKPSRILLALVGSMCLGVIFVTVVVTTAKSSELPLYSRSLLAIICTLIVFLVFYIAIFRRKTFHIDISGIGQIRLVEYNESAPTSTQPERIKKQIKWREVQLMADSTVWPCLMLLRLQEQNRQTIVLPILPDCVSAESFRALAVACRWIAAHNNQA